ncbi:MAG: ATP synthase A1 subunit C [Thermoplasmata archaeon]|nr:ATP synthase A1 subunit C [Thermoplasmata archaeon]
MAITRKLRQKLKGRIPIELGNYPYVCARVKGKKSKLISKDSYARLLKMETPSISRFLGEGQYREQMLALGAKYSGVDLIEMATRDNLAEVFTQIIEFSEGDLRTMVSRFLERWDVWNIKTIIRGKSYGAADEEIIEDLVPAGSFSTEFLRKLAEKETIEEVMEELGDTVYDIAYREAKGEEEEFPPISVFEDALDRAYYSFLLEIVPATTEPMKLFRMFIRKEIDMINIRTLLRIRQEAERIERDVFIGGGLELSKEDLETLVPLSIKELLPRLREYSFYDDISGLLREIETKGLNEVVRALEKHHLKEASTYSHLHPLSILPVLDYLISKEIEVENIRIIARGKRDGLSESTIRDLLVI